MGFSGKFVRTSTNNTRFSGRENWGTGVDPRHSQSAMGSDQGFPSLKKPHVPSVPIGVEDSYDPSAANADTRVLPAEREPRGHNSTGPTPYSSNEYSEIRAYTKRHQDNLGATLKNTYHMVMRSVTQTFGTPRVQSLDLATDDSSATATGDARRALRGKNSLAENNPGSPEVNHSGNYNRRGYEVYRWTDRRMARRTLTHTQRPVYLNVASTAHVTTSPQGSNYSPYGSPFPSVARLTSGTERPMMRREPRLWDESARTDGSEDAYSADTSQFNSWGL
jgi:hypothetical protein